ncbi:hypothetical protein BDF22DRAFT_695831 [Syncephalis plumigaleata]|nr:hypothetical protein BDF22DRAFT_695831 [Syncephalis plumigaleata]
MKQHLYDLLEQQCSANLSSCQAADDHPFRFGVSIKPHYKTLAYALAEQVLLRVSSDSCTIAYNDTILAKAASSIHLLNASDTVESNNAAHRIVTAIDAYKSIWMESCKDSTNEELDHRAKQAMHDLLFSELQLKEYAAFLGLQSTTGSILMQNYTENGVPLTMLVLPPSLATCIDTFTCRHTTTSTSRAINRRKPLPPNQLTVGAKALSKHSHRDVSQSFWGICTGTEHSKNVAANIALAKILSGTVWRNLHQLPHQIVAYEIRNKEGYGARWTLDTRAAISVDRINDNIYVTHKQWQFRGLLEPQMIDGHEQGWRH